MGFFLEKLKNLGGSEDWTLEITLYVVDRSLAATLSKARWMPTRLLCEVFGAGSKLELFTTWSQGNFRLSFGLERRLSKAPVGSAFGAFHPLPDGISPLSCQKGCTLKWGREQRGLEEVRGLGEISLVFCSLFSSPACWHWTRCPLEAFLALKALHSEVA